jgi:single-strand DNA-binding protein
LPEPPPPELLEQLGIEPHCTCTDRREQDEFQRASASRGRDPARTPQYPITATSVKETTMRDIATATLSGNLTREVELRALLSGTDVARLRVATTTRRRNGEEWVDKTNYFTVEVYGARARACAQYLGTGSRVVVDAELDWREWTDHQQHKRDSVTFRARQVLFEGGPPKSDSGNSSGENQDSTSATAEPSPHVDATPPNDQASASAEDLPF